MNDRRDDANTMWGGRFAAGPDAVMEAINASIDFDKRLAAQDVEASRAHAAMLGGHGHRSAIATPRRSGKAFSRCCQRSRPADFPFSKALEDIHMNVESRLKALIGEPAGRLHTARSRNDQVATDFRLWVRDQCDAAIAGLTALMRALLAQAEAGADMVMPGFTHLQVAQPVTWGHHMLAYVEMLDRDRGRFRDARARMNEMPARRRGAGRHLVPDRPPHDGAGARLRPADGELARRGLATATSRSSSSARPRSAPPISAASPRSW